MLSSFRKLLYYGCFLVLIVSMSSRVLSAQVNANLDPVVNMSSLFLGINYFEFITPSTRPTDTFTEDERYVFDFGLALGLLITTNKRVKWDPWRFTTLGQFSLIEGVANYGFSDKSRLYAFGLRARYVSRPLSQSNKNNPVVPANSFTMFRMAYGLEALYTTVTAGQFEDFHYIIYLLSISFGNFHWFEYIKIGIGYRQHLKENPAASIAPFELRISFLPLNLALRF